MLWPTADTAKYSEDWTLRSVPALGSKCILSEGLAPREMSPIGRIGSASTRPRTVIISVQFFVLQAVRGPFHARSSRADDTCRRVQPVEQQLDSLGICSPTISESELESAI